jgi:hypothetical protein
MRFIVNTDNKQEVRELRRTIKERLGRDAENVFGEAISNVHKHTEDRVAEVKLDDKGFEIYDHGPGVSREGAMKFFTNKQRQSGYGLLIITALGADVITGEDGTRIRWQQDPIEEQDVNAEPEEAQDQLTPA